MIEPAWLAAALARGREVWPELEVSAAELAAALRAQLAAREVAITLTDELDIDAGEMVLACACLRGDGAAVAAFRTTYFEPLVAALGRMGLDVAQRDDVWQALVVRLFVSPDGAPARIAHYAGRGQLHGLVKVAATRLALDVLEREHRHVSDDWLEHVPGADSTPELHWIKHQHRSELKQEVERAIATLSTKDRALLRLSLVERLGIDAIAATYQTHRSTVARWIAHARDALADRVRTQLVARWGITRGELDQIAPMVQSQLDLSLERLLSAS
jgi:RNA polymerase sigma-70 factor, ECF subfamily